MANTIDRIEYEADFYIEWEDVLDFFTRRGRPKHIQEKIEVEQQRQGADNTHAMFQLTKSDRRRNLDMEGDHQKDIHASGEEIEYAHDSLMEFDAPEAQQPEDEDISPH